MKAFGLVLMVILVLGISGRRECAGQEIGLPIGFIGGCEADLNADGNPDTALLIDTSKGYELVASIRSGVNAKTYYLSNSKSKSYLTCHYGKQLTATEAGPGKKKARTYQTNGVYLKLSQSEGSSAAFFWSGDKFEKVWLSD